MQSLRLIGHGLIAEYHDAGSPIVATAHAAEERLDALKGDLGQDARHRPAAGARHKAAQAGVSERSPA